MDNFISDIQALPGFVLVDPFDETEAIKGATATFEIADSVKDAESQRIGKVLSIGGEMVTVYGAKLSCPPQIKVGSLIIHKQYSYDNLKIKGKAYKFVAFNDLVGVIDE